MRVPVWKRSEAARGEAPAAQEDLRAVIEERKRLMAAGAPTPPLPPPGVAPARGGQAADNLGWEVERPAEACTCCSLSMLSMHAVLWACASACSMVTSVSEDFLAPSCRQASDLLQHRTPSAAKALFT